MMQQTRPAAAAARRGGPLCSSRRAAVPVVARASKSAKTTKGTTTAVAEPKRKGPGFFSQAIQALDLSEARSKSDADLLYEAKYGKLEGGRMSPEQYAALRRKVGGTAKTFFKEWVEEDVVAPSGFATSAPQVPFLPLLVGVVVALLGATVFVVEKTA